MQKSRLSALVVAEWCFEVWLIFWEIHTWHYHPATGQTCFLQHIVINILEAPMRFCSSVARVSSRVKDGRMQVAVGWGFSRN